MLFRYASLAAVGTGLLAVMVSTDEVTAGWPFRKSGDCCTPAEQICYDCPKPAKKSGRKELRDPPEGPVVASIPAVMLPQMAVAVPPQRLNAALTAADDDRAERLLKMLERLEARQSGTPSAAAAAAQKTPDERLDELLIELKRLKEELKTAKE